MGRGRGLEGMNFQGMLSERRKQVGPPRLASCGKSDSGVEGGAVCGCSLDATALHVLSGPVEHANGVHYAGHTVTLY